MLDGKRQVQNSSYLSGLVLCDLVLGVLLAVLALAVGASGLRNVDLRRVSSALIQFDVSASISSSISVKQSPSPTPTGYMNRTL